MAGTPPTDWRLALPAEYQSDNTFSKFKDVGGLAKSYKDLEGFLSTSTRMPKEGAPKEDWDKYYSAWGRPEKADGYKMTEGLPKEFVPPDEMKSSLFNAAHSLGLNQKQLDGLVSWAATEAKKQFEAEMSGTTAAEAELKEKWGYRFDNNRDRAVRTISTLAGMNKDHPFVKWLEATGNDKNPAVLQFFYEVSEGLGEDNLVTETSRREATEASEAQKKINIIMSDMNGPYFNTNDPRHNDTVQEVSRLYSVLNPEP